MQTIDVAEADGHLNEIIERLTPGETVILTRDDTAIATLQAAPSSVRKTPRFGTLRGTVLYIAPDFDEIPEGFEEYLP